MKKHIFTFAAICVCLQLFGCAVFEEEECIPTATVEQTAAVFNEVVARDNCDMVIGAILYKQLLILHLQLNYSLFAALKRKPHAHIAHSI